MIDYYFIFIISKIKKKIQSLNNFFIFCAFHLKKKINFKIAEPMEKEKDKFLIINFVYLKKKLLLLFFNIKIN